MYVVMNHLACSAAYAEHLERAFRQAGNMQGVPGFVSFMFLRRDEDEPERRHYAAHTTWESKQSYEAWCKSEAFTGAHAGAKGSPVESSLECFESLQ